MLAIPRNGIDFEIDWRQDESFIRLPHKFLNNASGSEADKADARTESIRSKNVDE